MDVLAQLFQSEDQTELIVIQNSLMSLFRKDPKGTLIGLFSQIKTGGDIVRERAMNFVSTKVKLEGSTLLNKEAEVTLLKEVRSSLDVSRSCNAVCGRRVFEKPSLLL